MRTSVSIFKSAWNALFNERKVAVGVCILLLDVMAGTCVLSGCASAGRGRVRDDALILAHSNGVAAVVHATGNLTSLRLLPRAFLAAGCVVPTPPLSTVVSERGRVRTWADLAPFLEAKRAPTNTVISVDMRRRRVPAS